ncbi:MAG: thioesterase [Bacteroidales bacterium]|nr:thioesterase [Bacteroidales bacterium]
MNNSHSKNIKVLSTYCDPILRLTPVMMLTLFEEIADEHAMELDIDGPTLRKRDKAYWVVRQVRLELNDVIRDHDDITVKTWPAEANGFRCGRSYQIFKQNQDEPAVRAFAEWVLIDSETKKIRPANSIKSPDIQYIKERAIETPLRRFKNIFTEDDFVYERIVRPCEIDVSHHTNNVKYCAMLLDSFSVREIEEMNIKELEIYYEAESHESDVLRIYRKASGNGWQLAIKRGDDVVTMAFIGI